MQTPTASDNHSGVSQDLKGANPLSGLEISGAVCAHLIHDLSNLLSGIMGNSEYALDAEADPASVRKAIEAIGISSNEAGKLLRQCLPLQGMVSNEAFACDVNELALVIAEASVQTPGWLVAEPGPLHGQVRVQPRWFVGAVWQIARDAGVDNGEIEFLCGPAVFPVVWHGARPVAGRAPDLFQITLRYRSEQPLFSPKGAVDTARLGLVAAHELVRRFRGQVQSRPKPPGRQEISILLPLT